MAQPLRPFREYLNSPEDDDDTLGGMTIDANVRVAILDIIRDCHAVSRTMILLGDAKTPDSDVWLHLGRLLSGYCQHLSYCLAHGATYHDELER
jgi:hypothetical protein